MAKKRYYQGKKDRMDESRAMKGNDYRHRRSGGFNKYDGIMGEDPTAMANMPRNAICEEYEQIHGTSYDMDDTMARMNEQIRRDQRKVKRNVNWPLD